MIKVTETILLPNSFLTPEKLYTVRLDNDELSQYNIFRGDLLIVDAEINVKDKELIIFSLNNKKHYGMLDYKKQQVHIENNVIKINENTNFFVIGVILNSISI